MSVEAIHPTSAAERKLAESLNSQGLPNGTITDPGHVHTGTTAASTATVTAMVFADSVHYEAPITADLVAIVDTLDPIADGALTIIANSLDFPRKLQVRIVDANASISAGVVTLVGVGVRGQALSQAIPLTGGTQTVVTTDAFASLTSATVTALAGAAAGDTISIGPGTALGLPGTKTPTAGTFAVHKSNVTNVNETVGTVDATAGTIIPTSVPNGTRTYDFWYTYTATPTQASHTHTITTDSEVTGITTSVGSVTYFHRAVSETTVTAAAASSLATSLTLVNNMYAVYMGDATNRVAGVFPGHAYDAVVHKAADSTNLVSAAYPATDLATAITLANEFYTDYNAHLTQSGVHDNNDGTNTASSSSATDQSSLNTRLNDLRTQLLAHIASGVPRVALRIQT